MYSIHFTASRRIVDSRNHSLSNAQTHRYSGLVLSGIIQDVKRMNIPPPTNTNIVAVTNGQTNVQQIGNLIRHWVHYDNSIANLNKQIKTARDVRNNYEAQVIQLLRATNMTNPVIQTGSGRVIVSEDKHHAPLTFTSVEGLLHQYYAKKVGSRDETGDIIKFIKANRESHVTPCLKRQGVPRSRSNSD